MSRHAVALALALVFGGCGNGPVATADLCERLAHPPNKLGNCGPLVFDIKVYDEAKCAGAMASCTADDKEGLTMIVDCFAALAPCENGNELHFTTQAFACTLVATVTLPCQTALTMAQVMTSKPD